MNTTPATDTPRPVELRDVEGQRSPQRRRYILLAHSEALHDDAARQGETGTVKAKDAPLGVQLWPTISPEYAPNFTLDAVTRQLGSNGREYVIWHYQNGNTRTFLADEDVAVRIG